MAPKDRNQSRQEKGSQVNNNAEATHQTGGINQINANNVFVNQRNETAPKDGNPKNLYKVYLIAGIVLAIIGLLKYFGVSPVSHQEAPVPDRYPLPQVISTPKICSEVLGNLRETELAINNIEDFKKNPEKYKFIHVEYDKANTFNNDELDRQMANFYTNVKRVNPKFNTEDFKVMCDQGNDVKRLLNEFFGCVDYFEGKVNYQAVSQDSVTVVDPRNVASGVTVEVKIP